MTRSPDPVIRALKRQLIDVLVRHIEQRFTRFDVPQSHVADTLGISQPRLNALLHRREAMFSLDALIGLCTQFELEVRLRVVRPYSKG